MSCLEILTRAELEQHIKAMEWTLVRQEDELDQLRIYGSLHDMAEQFGKINFTCLELENTQRALALKIKRATSAQL